MIDHFLKYSEALPCITVSAEETCDHLISSWIAIHGCPMTLQSDNGKAFVGELTRELMRRSQFDNKPLTNQWLGRETKTGSGVDFEGLLLPIHD